MPKLGQRHGRIIAITEHYGQRGRLKCTVRCDCGVEKEIWAGNFYKTESCGCYQKEVAGLDKITHGYSRKDEHGHRSAEYNAWGNMLKRCNYPNAVGYSNYGGRGISVCERWMKFENFIADLGPKPSPKHSIDRIDNDGNYEPGNVRWATRAEQASNKRNNVHLTVGDEEMILADAARRVGVADSLLSSRLSRGWSAEDAVTVPPVSRPKLQIKSGDRFGILTVLKEVPNPFRNSNHTCYLTRCDCGVERVEKGTYLASGATIRCGRSCALKYARGVRGTGVTNAVAEFRKNKKEER